MIFQMKLSSITSLTMGLLSYELRTTCCIGLQGEKKNGKKKQKRKTFAKFWSITSEERSQ